MGDTVKTCVLFRSLFIIALVSFSSCSKSTNNNQSILPDNDDLLLQHTKQTDIPIPIGFIPTRNNSISKTENNTLCYVGKLNISQCVTFYKQVMELDGWSIQDFSVDREGLLFCNKTGKSCALSIRPTIKSRTKVSIFTHNQSRHAVNDQDDFINKKIIEL
ncbi:hypothetical protein KAT92_03905 [Candidatus Babeliales bacterium]|nr:hypothetical protein [Candidatus Babeliales bacterium]